MAGMDFQYYEGQERLMGTVFRLHAFHLPGRRRQMESLADRLFEALIEDNRRLSIYQTESLVNRINREAGKKPVPVDRDTYRLLEAARGYWKLTGGLFDITVGVLMRARGFFADAALPEGKALELEECRPLIGCDKLELDPQGPTARLERSGMLLDLGGLAKGWCVERRASILQESGLEDFVISAGTSTVLARGAPPGEEGWPGEMEEFAREQPDGGGALLLKDCAVSVSANYRNTLPGPGGVTIRHIMNPLTLEPVSQVRRVVVTGPDAAEDEALSTAYLIQGGLTGCFSLENRPDITVSFRFPT